MEDVKLSTKNSSEEDFGAIGKVPEVVRSSAVVSSSSGVRSSERDATDSSLGPKMIESPSHLRQVGLNLVVGQSSLSTKDCQFWVGLACAGPLTPTALMDAPNLDSLFKQAASEGLCESGPVMLTDTAGSGARFIYLLQVPGKEFRDRAIWMHDLVATVRAWAPGQVGFYIAPSLLTANTGYELLIQTISELIRSTSTNQFYLLVGEHGLNPLVNAAVKMKHEIEETAAAEGRRYRTLHPALILAVLIARNVGMTYFSQDLLKDRVALITGGGTGINFGIAKALTNHGAKVVLMGRRTKVLEQAVDQLKESQGSASFVAGDVRDSTNCQAAVSHAVEHFGCLDILVNGAAGNFLCPSDALSPNGFKTVVDIDLNGTFNMCHSAYTALQNSSSAVILNISATLHYQGTELQSHVMAAKAGIDALGRNLACEWGPKGIRVVGIAPGPIGDTEGMRRLAPLGADKKIAEATPLRRLGTVDDIAQAALFLVSPAASYITGETLVVDGAQWLSTPPLMDRATWEKFSRN